VNADDRIHPAAVDPVADRTIEDAEERGTENMTVAQILARSSNVGAVTIGLEVAPKNSARIEKFGFGKPTGVQFRTRNAASSPSSTSTRARRWATAIARAWRVTPMQMVAGYTAIADDGICGRRS